MAFSHRSASRGARYLYKHKGRSHKLLDLREVYYGAAFPGEQSIASYRQRDTIAPLSITIRRGGPGEGKCWIYSPCTASRMFHLFTPSLLRVLFERASWGIRYHRVRSLGGVKNIPAWPDNRDAPKRRVWCTPPI